MSIIERVQAHFVNDRITSDDLHRYSLDMIADIKTTIGITVSGRPFQWQVLHPSRLFASLASMDTLQDALAAAIARTPPSQQHPWHLLVGFDEFVPGNKLKTLNHRKSMVLSFTFAELAGDCDLNEKLWFTPIVVRANIIKNCEGGWSHMLRQVLRMMLIGPEGMTTSGIALIVKGRPLLLYAKLHVLLSDGDGLRMALDWRGANAVRPCFKHSNIVSRRSDLAEGGFVDITCSNASLMRRAAPTYLEELMDLCLAADIAWTQGTMSRSRRDDVQKCTGLHANAHGLLADRVLRECFHVGEVARYDWMHSALQDGFLNTETYLLVVGCLFVCLVVCLFVCLFSCSHTRCNGPTTLLPTFFYSSF